MEKTTTGFRFGTKRTKLIQTLGEVKYKGRSYRLVRVQVSTGEQYFSLRLYNAQGKFIKQFMMEPDVVAEIAQLLFDHAPRWTVKEIARRFPHLPPD